jgi:hypothetical protein
MAASMAGVLLMGSHSDVPSGLCPARTIAVMPAGSSAATAASTLKYRLVAIL